MPEDALSVALADFENILAREPNSFEAHVGRATTLRKLQRPLDALESYARALSLRPDAVSLHLQRAAVLVDLYMLDDALGAVDAAMAAGLDQIEIQLNRVTLLIRLRRHEDALAACERILETQPTMPWAHIGRGVALLEMGHAQAALDAFDRAVALTPDSAPAHAARGRALKMLGHRSNALASYDRALAIDGRDAASHCNRGVVLEEFGEWSAALASFDKAIAIHPHLAEAHCNRGIVLRDLNRLSDAMSSFDRAIAIDPDFARAQFNRSMTLLATGRFEEGWTAFEWRWKTDYRPNTGKWLGEAKLWLGQEPLNGKTIVLLSEGGLGDTIQFCRYASLVADCGAHVALVAPRPLKILLGGLEGVSLIISDGDPLQYFDYYSPLMSLPLAFKSTLNSVPAKVPYLCSSSEARQRWQSRMRLSRNLRVGLVWSGGFRAASTEMSPVGARRDIPLAKLAALRHPAIDFYSLQKGQRAEHELSVLNAGGWNGPMLTDFTGELKDFAETAALVGELDLVISVDTSTAHLAGALGKSVWVLNRFDSCWRWLTERVDNPWYPTARIYTQPAPGDWDSVVLKVRADLHALVASKFAANAF